MYGPAIAGVNLILLISSTILIYLGSVLVNFYLLPTLDFVTSNFSSVPNLMLAVGTLGLLAGLLGIIVGAVASRIGLIFHAVLLSLIFILQLASIFTTSELRSGLENQILDIVNFDVLEVTNSYWTDQQFQSNWDEVQRTYSCCGLLNLNSGYKDWQLVNVGARPAGEFDSVPDSCCILESKDCGEHMQTKIDPHLYIYTHGCLSILQGRMNRDVKPVLLAYLGCGVLLAILQIVSIVLSSAYSAALSRRENREQDEYKAARNGS